MSSTQACISYTNSSIVVQATTLIHLPDAKIPNLHMTRAKQEGTISSDFLNCVIFCSVSSFTKAATGAELIDFVFAVYRVVGEVILGAVAFMSPYEYNVRQLLR